jgi:hypothetical protein
VYIRITRRRSSRVNNGPTWVEAVYRNNQVEDEIKNGESVSYAGGRPFVKMVMEGEQGI